MIYKGHTKHSSSFFLFFFCYFSFLKRVTYCKHNCPYIWKRKHKCIIHYKVSWISILTASLILWSNSKYDYSAHKSAAGSGSYKKDILSSLASHEVRCMSCIPLDEHMAEKPQTSPRTSTWHTRVLVSPLHPENIPQNLSQMWRYKVFECLLVMEHF